MSKGKKQVYRDAGAGDSTHSLEFAQLHLEELSMATSITAYSKNVAPSAEWDMYNVRFATPLGQEFQFSGLNIGYKGTGPQTFVKVLKLIGWNINKDVLFQNEELQIVRELPPPKKDEGIE